jgi:xanthine dehydrogenase accessory factor
LLARAAELAAAERPFALATVVAVRRPTSAKPGAHGIIHPDRTIEGWVGGSCAQPIVVREALRSLEDGQPRLLRLSPEGTSEGQRADGVLEFVMTCHSKGTLEVYVEPHLPRPALWVAGTTPIAAALVELGASAGYRVTLVDRAAAADPGAFPAAERVLGEVDLGALDPEVMPSIVVATQGQWDEDALDRALRRDRVGYVGLIASPLRAEAVRDYLRDVGIPDERLAGLHAPAGLDLGGETPEEVALSILAELVQLRRQARETNSSTGAGPSARPGPVPIAIEPVPEPAALRAAAPDMVLVDPVCGMTVDAADVRHTAEHDGITYAFCCAPCRRQFTKNPDAFLAEALAAEAATPA